MTNKYWLAITSWGNDGYIKVLVRDNGKDYKYERCGISPYIKERFDALRRKNQRNAIKYLWDNSEGVKRERG